ncbi:MAG: hypothetical protein P8L78_12035 [Mariniblastus sp.]|nr:hypothetical protein [Mariniblastus sp.]MDG2182417.1 hypothetical protein [Mariniblastus sp.]
MTMISKPDANPIAAAILTWFVFGIGHIVINGQTNKWIMTIVVTFIGTILCFLPGLVLGILSVVDSYKTAERLKAGESIPENEYSNVLLFKVCKLIDKKATCKLA